MHESVLQSGLETLLIAVPFVAVLFMAMFRLDAVIAAPRQTTSLRRRPSGTDEHGRVLFSDPDGRPWPSARGSK